MSSVCTNCGSSDIDIDAGRGDAVCTNCGSVLEDQIIVSEVQFQENSAGASSVIGQYVSSEGNKSHSLGSGFHHGIGKESRQITLQNAKKRIQQLGGQLRLNQHCIDTAFNFFKMALNRRLTRGRRNAHVVAACLYIVCRTEGTPHMLLDFSDVLQTDVYVLGRTYLHLSRALCINIPVLDPCLYIQRFAHKLEFADKTHEVAMTALRLVSRMKRDWMAHGRRPSGLCGAALLVAARIHDFRRSIKEIIKVVKIGEGTIRKRLSEFEQTPSSELTIEEFQKIDLEEEMDPPCFTEGKRRAKLAQLEEQVPELTSEITALQEEIENAIEDANTKKHAKNKKTDAINADISDGTNMNTPSTSMQNREVDTCTDFVQKEILRNAVSDNDSVTCVHTTSSPASSTAEQIVDLESQSSLAVTQLSKDGTKCSSDDPGEDPEMIALEQQVLDSLLQELPPLNAQEAEGGGDCARLGPRPTAASLGLKESIEECMKVTEQEEVEEESGELDLTGIDDSEIEKYLLEPEEIRIRAKMWIATNADYLKEMKEKEEREAREIAEGIVKPEPKKKRRSIKKKLAMHEASTAGEAIEKMLAEKKISSKINYDVLKGLNGIGGSPAANSLGSTAVKRDAITAGMVFDGGSIEATPVTLKSVKEERSKLSLKNEPAEKKPKLEQQVIVESGPVDYAAHEAEEVGEDAEEEEEEEEEEHEGEPVSAAQLMGHTEGVDDYGDEGYDYDD